MLRCCFFPFYFFQIVFLIITGYYVCMYIFLKYINMKSHLFIFDGSCKSSLSRFHSADALIFNPEMPLKDEERRAYEELGVLIGDWMPCWCH